MSEMQGRASGGPGAPLRHECVPFTLVSGLSPRFRTTHVSLSNFWVPIQGLDHRVGHLILMTTEKMSDSIQRGIAIRELPRHPEPSSSHMVGASGGEVACGNDSPSK